MTTSSREPTLDELRVIVERLAGSSRTNDDAYAIVSALGGERLTAERDRGETSPERFVVATGKGAVAIGGSADRASIAPFGNAVTVDGAGNRVVVPERSEQAMAVRRAFTAVMDSPVKRLRYYVHLGELDVVLDQLEPLLSQGLEPLQSELERLAYRYGEILTRAAAGHATAANQTELTRSLLTLLDRLEQALEARAIPASGPPLDPLVPFDLPSHGGLEKIIGAQSHLKDIAWIERGLRAARSVCQIRCRDQLGTGFLIPGGRLMTNEHVISHQDWLADTCVRFDFEKDAAGRLKPVAEFSLAGATIDCDKALDCAVVTLDPELAETLSHWGQLELDIDATPRRNEHVTIVQHPEGGPKQIAMTANQVRHTLGAFLRYTTDTLPGSSGSPVFNDEWKVIALHHAGGWLRRNALGFRLFANQGILISAIARHPTLLPRA